MSVSSPSHRASQNSLSLPPNAGDKPERRRSHRVPPPPEPLDIPEPVDVPVKRPARRPPSPLRNSYTPDSDEGSFSGSEIADDDDGDQVHSPSPSMTKFANNIASRVGALVGSTGSRSSNHLPTEAEIEAEAVRERERSRREAERIMRLEAEERKMIEDGVNAMFDQIQREHAQGLPPPPVRSQTGPPSPSPSQKEKDGWFAAVKNKLTPTKEPLTPAQQIIQETKAREKEKKKSKDKEVKEWPATPSRKYSDPAFLNLAQSTSPEPITPPRPISQSSPMMTPSPKRSIDLSQDTPPIYAQFNSQGTLDIPVTLLTIARRFEKLEKWTVSHVRALEDRMGDVERWLVEKEKEKEKEKEEAATSGLGSEKASFQSDEDENGTNEQLVEIREELVELQGRMGELGREMAKLMTAPSNLASGPARNAVVSQSQPVSSPQSAPNPAPTQASYSTTNLVANQPPAPVPPTPNSIAPRSLPTVPTAPLSTPRNQTNAIPPRPPREAYSPPSNSTHRSSSIVSSSGRTRLPYPTGDYTSPPGSIPTKQDVLSPTNSPPSSVTEATRRRPVSIAGLPTATASVFLVPQPSGSGPISSGMPPRGQDSPPTQSLSPVSPSGPSPSNYRVSNISPTPRKRYTVALGQPITGLSAASTDFDELDSRESRHRYAYTASTSESDDHDDNSFMSVESGAESEGRTFGHSREDTIGKSEVKLTSAMANPPNMPNDTLKRGNSTSPRGSASNSPGMRMRAQSSYGPPSGYNYGALSRASSPSNSNSPVPITPLRPRVRSKSIDRIGLGISGPNGKFIDPLVLRRQEMEAEQPRMPKFERGKKVPVGELVAFFDKDRHR